MLKFSLIFPIKHFRKRWKLTTPYKRKETNESATKSASLGVPWYFGIGKRCNFLSSPWSQDPYVHTYWNWMILINPQIHLDDCTRNSHFVSMCGFCFFWYFLPKTNSEFTPEDEWLEYNHFLLGPLFSGANLLLVLGRVSCWNPGWTEPCCVRKPAWCSTLLLIPCLHCPSSLVGLWTTRGPKGTFWCGVDISANGGSVFYWTFVVS